MASILDPFGLLDLAKASVRVGVSVVSRVAEVAITLTRGPSEGLLELTSGPTLGEKMVGLQRRAVEHGTTSSQAELFHRILDQLVPDEARILGALADGSRSALLNVRGLKASGGKNRVLLQNASLVGRTANLALPAMTPVYVGHLLMLGLLETGPEDPQLKDDYQILAAEAEVLKAIKAGSVGMIRAKLEKGTLCLSPLGMSLWAAAEASGRVQ